MAVGSSVAGKLGGKYGIHRLSTLFLIVLDDLTESGDSRVVQKQQGQI